MKWKSSALAVLRYWLNTLVTISIRFLYREKGVLNHKFKRNGSASTATFTTQIDRMSLAGIATSEIERCLIL